jgi:hypothetical protein
MRDVTRQEVEMIMLEKRKFLCGAAAAALGLKAD